MSVPIPVAVAGAAGRLGSALVQSFLADRRFTVVAGLVRPGSERAGHPIAGGPATLRYTADLVPAGKLAVLVEASRPEAVAPRAAAAAQRGAALLVAVTGLSAATQEALEVASRAVPILIAPNLTLGAAVLARLVRIAAKELADFDLEISETHHAAKRDSPSGTALWLAREAAAARGWDGDSGLVLGRSGPGPRGERQIGLHSLRAGTAPGEHRVRLGGRGEHLELVHVAESREAFAMGALRAASWLASAPAGRYNLGDIVAEE